jgi:hypothetical protein
VRDVTAEDEAGGKGDRNALEGLRHDLPLENIGRSAPYPVERVLQFDKIALDGLDRSVALPVSAGSIHSDTHAAHRLRGKTITAA